MRLRADAGVGVMDISPGDLDEGVAAFLRFADQDDPQRAEALGTPFERVDNFRAGFLGGLGACGL